MLTPSTPGPAATAAANAAATIRGHRPDDHRIAIVLGSGLARVADLVEHPVRIAYADLPGFPLASVSGHAGAVVAGRIAGVPVVVLSGRAHYYEHGDATAMRIPLETAAALGCSAVVLTCAAGSTRPEMAPGSLMAISDHIAFSGANPLIGTAGDGRFVDMVAAYDPELRALFAEAAAETGVGLGEGVYLWFSGPSFETPAEIRMARALGADAVGMSTVPEVILARYLGMRVAAVATITNLAAGLAPTGPSHAETKTTAAAAAERLATLIGAFVPRFAAADGGA